MDYDINYFEDEYFKILVQKNNFNYKFNINIDDNLLKIKRIDHNNGWGKNVILIIRDKTRGKNKNLDIGISIQSIKIIDFIIDTTIDILEKNYYEDDIFKLFYISKEFNDIFKINYIKYDNIITIQRIDCNEGWGQNLNLKYIEKKSKKEKIINIGTSITNIKNIIFDNNKFNYVPKTNNFESLNYLITIYENKYLDLFTIFFYEENNTIFIKRVDCNEGWGQQLILNIYDINKNHNFIIYIGSSHNNELYKKINLNIYKCYVALTTIPTRANLPIFLENIKDILTNQTYNIDNLFITIPNKYKRFNESFPSNILDELLKIPKIIIIKTEEDYGPSSKYLGPLLNYYNLVKNNILIIIDDDRIYNKNLVRNFVIGFNSYNNITFSSGLWYEYFSKNYMKMSEDYLECTLYKERNNNNFYYGQGLGGFFGFAIYVKNIEKFINYNLIILNKIDKSFYHDEGIILGYIKYTENTILYLKHYGCNYIKEELVDALCNSNLVNRGKIEKDILQITNLESLI